MALIVYYLVLLLITSYAIATGGRYERYIGGMMILGSLAATTTQKLTHNAVPLSMLTLVDLALVSGLMWITWRYRRPWVWVIVAVQTLVFLIDVSQLCGVLFTPRAYSNIQALLTYLQVATLGSGVLWRVYGPPAAPPDTPPIQG